MAIFKEKMEMRGVDRVEEEGNTDPSEQMEMRGANIPRIKLSR